MNPTRRRRVGVPALKFCIRQAPLYAVDPIHIRHPQIRALHTLAICTSHLLAAALGVGDPELLLDDVRAVKQ